MNLNYISSYHHSCYIFGSGRSCLSLSENERNYLNKQDATLAMNRYYLFYEKVGVLPKALFLSDFHEGAVWTLLNSVEKACREQVSLRFYINYRFRALNSHSFCHPLYAYKIRRLFRQQSDLSILKWLDQKHNLYFRSVVYGPRRITRALVRRLTRNRLLWPDHRFWWAEKFSQELFFHRGSLTTAINLANLLWPKSTIKLIGIDLNDHLSFYDEEIQQRPELLDQHYVNASCKGYHATLEEKMGGSVLRFMPAIRDHLDRKGVRLVCCNPMSRLITEGILPHAPIVET